MENISVSRQVRIKPAIYLYAVLFLFLLSNISCNQLKKEEFTLTITLMKGYEDSQNKTMPEEIKALSNYYTDSLSCPQKIYFPKVTLNRPDTKQSASLEIPLAGADKLRQSLGVLSAKKLREAYDNAIDELMPPDFIYKKLENTSLGKPTNAKGNVEYIWQSLQNKSIDSLKSIIAKKLCSSKLTMNVSVIITDAVEPSKQPNPFVVKEESTETRSSDSTFPKPAPSVVKERPSEPNATDKKKDRRTASQASGKTSGSGKVSQDGYQNQRENGSSTPPNSNLKYLETTVDSARHGQIRKDEIKPKNPKNQ